MNESRADTAFPAQVRYGHHTAKVRSANGVEGDLCVTSDGSYFLRVADAQAAEGFVDYDLRHSDLRVRILDEDAVFYDLGANHAPLLDHAPATLGLTAVET